LSNAGSVQAGSPASTLSLTSVPLLGVDAEELSSTNAKPASTFRLFDLPQELQDAIFEFAYTEPCFKFVSKTMWDVVQRHTRRSTGKPKVDFPMHKVNEWMVSKKYFRAAAQAWVESQTSFELVRDRLTLPRAEMGQPFPPTGRCGRGFELFFEFGKTFPVDLSFWPSALLDPDYRCISLCRRIRGLIFVVHNEHFDVLERGLAWEVEFTDEELMSLLERSGFTLPSSVEKMEMLPERQVSYADTDTKVATLASNVANFGRLMWQHRSKKVHADTAEADHGLLYLGSKVKFNAPTDAGIGDGYVIDKHPDKATRSPHSQTPKLDHPLMSTATPNTKQLRDGPQSQGPFHQLLLPQVMSNNPSDVANSTTSEIISRDPIDAKSSNPSEGIGNPDPGTISCTSSDTMGSTTRPPSNAVFTKDSIIPVKHLQTPLEILQDASPVASRPCKRKMKAKSAKESTRSRPATNQELMLDLFMLVCMLFLMCSVVCACLDKKEIAPQIATAGVVGYAICIALCLVL